MFPTPGQSVRASWRRGSHPRVLADSAETAFCSFARRRRLRRRTMAMTATPALDATPAVVTILEQKTAPEVMTGLAPPRVHRPPHAAPPARTRPTVGNTTDVLDHARRAGSPGGWSGSGSTNVADVLHAAAPLWYQSDTKVVAMTLRLTEAEQLALKNAGGGRGDLDAGGGPAGGA